MIIKPRIRGFICTTAHPAGCAALVDEQIRWEERRPRSLAGRATCWWSAVPAATVWPPGSSRHSAPARGRCACRSKRSRPTTGRRAPAGTTIARSIGSPPAHNLYARSLNADAFADATKAQVAEIIKHDLGGIDLLVYSLASPVRTDPGTGVLYRSAIKPVGRTVHIKNLNVDKGVVSEVDLAPASDEEIQSTVRVMGGEDWERWIAQLGGAGLLNQGFKTIAYTYIGSELTWPIYWEGTLGKAKEDLDRAAAAIRTALAPVGGDARVAVLKAVVTQASSAIPVVPLYVSLLFSVMKERSVHEDCIRHIDRLFRTSAVWRRRSAAARRHRAVASRRLGAARGRAGRSAPPLGDGHERQHHGESPISPASGATFSASSASRPTAWTTTRTFLLLAEPMPRGDGDDDRGHR